jgi:hypothetical protein
MRVHLTLLTAAAVLGSVLSVNAQAGRGAGPGGAQGPGGGRGAQAPPVEAAALARGPGL